MTTSGDKLPSDYSCSFTCAEILAKGYCNYGIGGCSSYATGPFTDYCRESCCKIPNTYIFIRKRSLNVLNRIIWSKFCTNYNFIVKCNQNSDCHHRYQKNGIIVGNNGICKYGICHQKSTFSNEKLSIRWLTLNIAHHNNIVF